MNTADILDRAADLIEERGWNQGWYVNECGGLCAVGAMYTAAGVELPVGAEFPDIPDEVSNAVLRAFRVFGDHVKRLASAWNDAPGRTKEEVVSTLRAAAQAARAEQ